MVKYLFALFVLFAFSANAAPVAYKVDTGKSSIKFEAVQNGAPISGKFTRFDGVINFAKDDLKNSSARINIDMNSVTADYEEVPRTLKEKDWFDVSRFTTANFESTSFSSKDGKNFLADGKLTIKGISIPAKLNFTLAELTANKAVANGSATLSRTKYNIGWADTSSVKDAVTVTFHIVAVK
jgi:polyisoprenoid-binding protein YceI